MKIIQQTNKTHTQMMGYTIQAKTGEVLVIDGGNKNDKDELKRVIKKLGSRVHLWLITHPHSDHHDAVMEVIKESDDITYDKLGASQLPDEWAEKAKVKDAEELLAWNAFAREHLDERYFNVKKGQVFQLGSMKIEVIGECNPEILTNPINNQSAVYRITEEDFAFLVLGDLGVEAGEKLINSGESVCADGVQMAHHGQRGVNEEFYQAVKPTYCFWPTPDWLWNNSVPGWSFKTPETAFWMKKLNTVNILNFDYTIMFDTETKEITEF